jgi:hypothetical protein
MPKNGSSPCVFFLSRADQKAEQYICVTFADDEAFVIVNGKMKRFEWGEYNEKTHVTSYSNSNYKLTIKITKHSVGYETDSNKGILTVTNHSGQKVTKRIIGFCWE